MNGCRGSRKRDTPPQSLVCYAPLQFRWVQYSGGLESDRTPDLLRYALSPRTLRITGVSKLTLEIKRGDLSGSPLVYLGGNHNKS